MMIVGVYATLGVFLLLAARNPQAHRSLIWFTVWSSVVHGGIMAVQSTPVAHHGHLLRRWNCSVDWVGMCPSAIRRSLARPQ